MKRRSAAWPNWKVRDSLRRLLAVVNGPNLNWLGRREPPIYGTESWQTIGQHLLAWAAHHEYTLTFFQSNSEGALIDYLQTTSNQVGGVVFNPGAFAHTSVALRDCVAMLPLPVVEVHLSALNQREVFRRHSYLADVAAATITGFGWQGYRLGLELLAYLNL